MKFAPKYTPEQWAEARRLRGEGMTFRVIAESLGFANSKTIADRARQESWPNGSADAAGPAKPKPKPKPRAASPDTVDIRWRLAQRLYKIVEVRIRKMELSMQKQLQALEQDADAFMPPVVTADERESFAALIEQINQVTEMASEPAFAADGRRKSADINPELTALSDEIDADALAAASEKDQLRREIADKLARLGPSA